LVVCGSGGSVGRPGSTGPSLLPSSTGVCSSILGASFGVPSFAVPSLGVSLPPPRGQVRVCLTVCKKDGASFSLLMSFLSPLAGAGGPCGRKIGPGGGLEPLVDGTPLSGGLGASFGVRWNRFLKLLSGFDDSFFSGKAWPLGG